MKPRQYLTVIILVALALVVRLAFLWRSGAYGQIINDDGERYARIALSLLAGDGYAWGPGLPTAHRPFGYPWLLAGIVAAFGPSMAAVQWAQVTLGGFVVLATYTLGRRLDGMWVGVLAGLAVALHPVLIYLTGLAAPEAAALACEMGLLWCAWVVAGAGKGQNPPLRVMGADGLSRGKRVAGREVLAWVGFTLSGAAGILLRPDLLLMVWLLPVAAACVAVSRSSGLQHMWALATAALLATALAVLPPVIRNAAVFSEFIPFPTIGGATFWCGNNPEARGGCVNPSPATWPGNDPPVLGTRGWRGISETQSQARFYRAALAWIQSDPIALLRLLPAKLVRSWTLAYGDEAQERSLPATADWLHAAFGLAALAGLVVTLRKQDRLLTALLLAPVVAWLIKTIVFYGSARLTAPVLPIAGIFAAVGGISLLRRLRFHRNTT